MEKYWDVKFGKWKICFYVAAGKFGVELVAKCWKQARMVGGFRITLYRRKAVNYGK